MKLISSATTAAAFQHCQAIVRKHAKSFYFSGHFLPLEKRLAMFAIYAVCRTLDDIVDNAPQNDLTSIKDQLYLWRDKLDQLYQGSTNNEPILIAMRAVLDHYPVRKENFLELIEGMEMDLTPIRFQNFAELKLYCYRVASTVGLMGSEVFGYSSKDALPHAISLGIAMQLTNILRDIGEDLRAERIYLPLDELQRFNYGEADLRAGKVNEQFIALMRFQIERARQYYQDADAGIRMLTSDSRLTVLAASRLYGGILQAIERNRYDIFSRRASLSIWQKLARLPLIWFTRRRHFN